MRFCKKKLLFLHYLEYLAVYLISTLLSHLLISAYAEGSLLVETVPLPLFMSQFPLVSFFP